MKYIAMKIVFEGQYPQPILNGFYWRSMNVKFIYPW